MSPFHDVQHITWRIKSARDTRCGNTKYASWKICNGNFFLSAIESLEFIVFDGDVLLDILARQNDLLIIAFPVHGCHCPVDDYDRDTKDDDEEDIGLESTTVDDGRMRLTQRAHRGRR